MKLWYLGDKVWVVIWYVKWSCGLLIQEGWIVQYATVILEDDNSKVLLTCHHPNAGMEMSKDQIIMRDEIFGEFESAQKEAEKRNGKLREKEK
jgi:hypothetical protein